MLLVTISITLQQSQQPQQQLDPSLSRPCTHLSGQQRVQLLTGLARLAGVSKLAVGITQVKQQQQQQKQHAVSAASSAVAAAGMESLTCTVSAVVIGSCCSCLLFVS
jgi:hypothetical protein